MPFEVIPLLTIIHPDGKVHPHILFHLLFARLRRFLQEPLPTLIDSMSLLLLPFYHIPRLNKKKQELALSENNAIDIFLAKQFGLHGRNAWEEALINAFYSSSNCMFFQEIMNSFFWESSGKSEDEKAKYLDDFLNKTLASWGRIHEAHLVNNHSNGHYVGDRVTLLSFFFLVA